MLKLEKFLLTKTQLETGITLCISKVHQLLNDTEILCKNNGNESTAVALYTLAIEEFGKSLLLKKCIQASNEEKFQVPQTIFGRGLQPHTPKFDEAFLELPEECQVYQTIDSLHDGDKFPPKYKNHHHKAKKIAEDWEKTHPEIDIEVNFSLLFDFEVRKNALYVDWDDEKKRWHQSLEIEPYRHKYHKKIGYGLDSKTGMYIKHGIDSIAMTNFPYEEEEIELSEEEVFPEKILIAIEFFKKHLKKEE